MLVTAFAALHLRCAWCPAEIIGYAVWLYFRFPLSLRMVEEMLAVRGILVSHETVRQWGLKFGHAYANAIRRRAPQRGDKWHLDEAMVTIAGKKHWLWRAVDQEGFVLDILIQSRRGACRTVGGRLRPRPLRAGLGHRWRPWPEAAPHGSACSPITLNDICVKP